MESGPEFVAEWNGYVKGRSGASFSKDEQYRYLLWRKEDMMISTPGRCIFIMLNPSTANARVNDPTVRRCCDFAWYWQYERLIVLNLYAYRATDPMELLKQEDPIGPHNDKIIHAICTYDPNDFIVCAWGNSLGQIQENRALEVIGMLLKHDVKLHHLGLNMDGSPRHPLYIAGTTKPTLWRA